MGRMFCFTGLRLEALLNKAAVAKQVQILSKSPKVSNQVAVKEISKLCGIQYSITAQIQGFLRAVICC